MAKKKIDIVDKVEEIIEPVVEEEVVEVPKKIFKTVIADNLNFRMNPDKSSSNVPAKKYLKAGEVVEVITDHDTIEGWSFVDFEGIRGYVMTEFIK